MQIVDANGELLHITLMIDNELKALIPPLTSDELSLLEASIKADGCRDAVTVWEGKNVVVDGHNRYAICQRNNLPLKVQFKSFDSREDVVVWMCRNQLGRRNITQFQRDKLALEIEEAFSAKARLNQSHGLTAPNRTLLSNSDKSVSRINTREEIAAIAGTSSTGIAQTKAVLDSAPEPVIKAAERGDITRNQAYELTRVLKNAPEPVKSKVIELSERGKLPTLNEVKGFVKQEKRTEKVESLQEQAWLTETFNVIYADPPWRYDYTKAESRAIENHYPTMTLDDICKLPIASITANDAVLFLWATSPKLEEAMRVVREWGFTYRTCAIWDKEKIGMGYYFRQQHELLLVATKGQLPVPEPSDRISSVIRSERGRHSEKPELFYEIIEAMYPEYPKVELFSRNARQGWKGWGNEYANAA